MPPDTPPSRVKKAWRRPGMAESSGDSEHHEGSAFVLRPVLIEARQQVRLGSETAEYLEHRSHAAAPAADQPFHRARNVLGNLCAGLRHQGRRAGFDAEPFEEIALRDRAVRRAHRIFGRARQRLEIDMRGHVGLARRLQGIGEAVARDRLEGVAGVAAQMAVIDDQRRAVLVAHACCDLHHLGIGPPFEHRADRCGAHQRRQQHLEARARFGRGREDQLAGGVDSTTRSCQPLGSFTAWWIGSTSKYSLAKMTAGPSGTSSMCRARRCCARRDSVAFCFSRNTGLISTR